MKKIVLFLSLAGLVFVSSGYCYEAQYSLTGPSMLSATATYNYPTWSVDEAVNGIFTYPNIYYAANVTNDGYDGWWAFQNDSIVISFNDGMQHIDKVQIINGYHYATNATQTSPMTTYQLFYTTDATPGLDSLFNPVTNLTLLNASDTYVSDNIINSVGLYEILAQFDAVDATAIMLTQTGNGVLNEITIDGTGVTPIPEPASMILLGMAVVGVARKKIFKK